MSSLIDNEPLMDLSDLRTDAPPVIQVHKPIVKPPIKTGVTLSPEQSRAILDAVKVQTKAQETKEAEVEMIPADSNKHKSPKNEKGEFDWSKVTLDNIYDTDLPETITIKALSEDELFTIKLKERYYEPRWVYNNARRIGQLLAKGFVYISLEDLENPLMYEKTLNAEGHIVYGDLVAMKIDKPTYFAAIKHAEMRARNTVNQTTAAKRGQAAAEAAFRESKFSSDYVEARRNKYMEFYVPKGSAAE